MTIEHLGPWPELNTARSFLRFLAGFEEAVDFNNLQVDFEQCASWLIDQGIGPLAYARCRQSCPELAALLEGDAFSAVAENSMHWQNLQQMNAEFKGQSIPLVLLKGAALAETVYGDRDRRTMSDIDLWVRQTDLEAATGIMRHLGFYTEEKEERPLAFQLLADGEIQFYRQGWQKNLAEFHLSPYSGWWLKRTAVVNNDAIWSRIAPLNGWESFYEMSAEDMIVHIAVHMSVNHQCGFWAVRSLMDLALTIKNRSVNWDTVAENAQKWRVRSAVWLPLYLLQQLFLIESLEHALKRMRPPFWQQKSLKKLVTPESLILGTDLRTGRKRFLFLLLLVDRMRDMFYLVYRTLWPERLWLFYRYGPSAGHWHHLNRILRHGQV